MNDRLSRAGRTKGLFAALLSPLILIGTACQQQESAEVRAPSEDRQARAQAVPPQIPGPLIENLKKRVPQLREAPQPEPQPRRGATPAEIPRRLREALTPDVLETITGSATFYADKFEGRRTASGIPFRQNQLVAAHRAYPFGTVLRVTNLRNDRSVNVRVVDRGPFGAPRKSQRPVIDLSRRAAEQLGFIAAGRTQVRVEVLQWGRGLPR